MAKLYNLARMTTATTGTGTITLGSAVAGFLSFAGAGIADGDIVTYAIKDGSNSEIGRGTYTASGTTLTRSVLKSTNSNTAISLSGSAQVMISASAEDVEASLSGLSYANIAINSGMEISQEHGTSSVSVSSGVTKYSVDQFIADFVSGTIVLTAQQISATPTPPSGFKNALQLKSTTGASLSSTHYVLLNHPVEGVRVSKFAWGAAGAQTITIGFWVYATITGTMTVSIRNGSGARSYLVDATISNATTWEYKTVTIPGDTSGTWPTDTSVSWNVSFCFGGGSTYQGTAATWNSGGYVATSSTTNFFASNNNVVCVTGVTILPGSDMPPVAKSGLLRRHYSDELRTCQRYWEQVGCVVSASFASSVGRPEVFYQVEKRVSPTLSTIVNSGSGAAFTVNAYTPTKSAYQSVVNSAEASGQVTANARM